MNDTSTFRIPIANRKIPRPDKAQVNEIATKRFSYSFLHNPTLTSGRFPNHVSGFKGSRIRFETTLTAGFPDLAQMLVGNSAPLISRIDLSSISITVSTGASIDSNPYPTSELANRAATFIYSISFMLITFVSSMVLLFLTRPSSAITIQTLVSNG